VLPAGQSIEQQRAIHPRFLRAASSAGQRDHIRHGLEKLDVVVREASPGRRVGTKHAEWDTVTLDQDAESARDPMVAQERWRAKTRLSPKVRDDNRLTGLDGVAGMRVPSRAERSPTDEAPRKTERRSEQQGRTAWQELKDSAELHPQGSGDKAGRALEQRVFVRAG
jgi:hypothetical protein